MSGTTTEYFYIGADLVSEKQGSNWTDYILFGGQRIAQQTGASLSTTTFLHTDHLGSTRVCTAGSDGTSAGTCDYEPYGEVQPGSTCSVPTNFRFAGMEWDDDLDLYHTWFRQYDTAQGRWLSVDPLPGSEGDPQSLNRYAYVLADPVNLSDKLGLFACPAGQTAVPVGVHWGVDSTGPFRQILYDCVKLPPSNDNPHSWSGYLDFSRLAGGGRGGWFPSTPAGYEIPFTLLINTLKQNLAWLGRIAQHHLALARARQLTDCEAMQRTFGAALGLFEESRTDAVKALIDTLTERHPTFPFLVNTNNSVPNVGVSGPTRFGQTGFQQQFIDSNPGSSNQVRHFVGYFGLGYLYGYPAAWLATKIRDRGQGPDVLLGLAAGRLGSDFARGLGRS